MSGQPPSHDPPGRLHSLVLTRRMQFLLDLGVLVTAFVLAYLLRFDFDLAALPLSWTFTQLPLVVVIQFSALHLTGIYSFVWRYVGMTELGTFARAAAFSAAPLLALRLGLPASAQEWKVPLSVLFVDTVLAFGGLLGLRVLRRGLWERRERALRNAGNDGRRRRVLLVGAGRAGVLAMREIENRGDLGLEVAGFVDDDPLKQATVIHGARVLGTLQDLPELVPQHRVEEVIVTIADAGRDRLRRIAEVCGEVGVKVRSIPGLFEILQGKVEISRFRDVDVEELLGREPVSLIHGRVRHAYSGRRILVTGAGGSIGAELARQVAELRPQRLLLVERAEHALFEIHREIGERWPEVPVEALVADVGDEPRVAGIFARSRPQVVLHAAAHKHVPMMETNAGEAIKNNVFATRTLGEIAGRFDCERFVLVSTDKAVRPTSVMGASKRLAELVVQRLDGRHPTRYAAVRFGNVMGSAGSVIPLFRQQIARGGPVTVTHPEMVRYFMTIPEAVHLVLQAGALGEGGEIFLLDMGEPIRILDLAKKMIRLSGLEPEKDVPIVFTGVRPGEKLHEELGIDSEGIAPTEHPKIFTGKLSGPPAEELELALAGLADLAREGDGERLRACLGKLLPEARLEAAEGRVAGAVG